ncbi:hypothetical protein LZD38_03685 [Streptococcus gallolyticus]|uniref:hypothetical protein n=1 Tax=Streptococcus gallolyticus TaxID=315405 RepID=UPI001F1765C6|nr:hypothetical protein [Streptococcus gallolyticus]MCF1633859.1 hypothetical protein [Streptococcus gallolyticus]
MNLRKSDDGNMGLIERFKILLKYHEGNVKSGVSRSGNLSGLFILYPIVFFMFYATMNDSELPMVLNKMIFYLGIIIWVTSFFLTIWDFFHDNQFLVGISTGLMFAYYLFTSPISSSAAWGDGNLNFIIFQETSIILYPIMWEFILAYSIVKNNGEICSEKTRRRLAYLMCTPLLIMGIPAILMAEFSDYYLLYLVWGLNSVFSFSIISGWFIILYPLRHKADLAVASKVQNQAVDALGDMLQEKHFDKERFK